MVVVWAGFVHESCQRRAEGMVLVWVGWALDDVVLAGMVRLGVWWVWAAVNMDVGFGWPVGDGRASGSC